MKKFMGEKIIRNNRGFSLVEILLVITIIAVVTALAINVFGAVSERSKVKTDYAQSINIKKAILAYIEETNDTGMTYMKNKSINTVSGLIDNVLSTTIDGKDISADNNGKKFGPYLDRKSSGIYPKQDGGSKSWKITYDTSTQQCDIEIVSKDEDEGGKLLVK